MSEFFPNCRVSQGYGMTECGHLTQGGASGGVLGRIVPGVKAKVVDTESGKVTGELLQPPPPKKIWPQRPNFAFKVKQKIGQQVSQPKLLIYVRRQLIT